MASKKKDPSVSDFAKKVIAYKEPSVEKRQPSGFDRIAASSTVDRPQPETAQQKAYIENMKSEQQDRRIREIINAPFHAGDEWAKNYAKNHPVSPETRSRGNEIIKRVAEFMDPKLKEERYIESVRQSAAPVRDMGEMAVRNATRNDLRSNGVQVAAPHSVDYLYEPKGSELHWDGLRKTEDKHYSEAFRAEGGPSGGKPIGGKPSVSDKPSQGGMQLPSGGEKASKPLTNEQLAKMANDMLAKQELSSKASMDAGPATGEVDDSGKKLPDWLTKYGR